MLKPLKCIRWVEFLLTFFFYVAERDRLSFRQSLSDLAEAELAEADQVTIFPSFIIAN